MPLETANNKVKEICDVLRRETLEPAQNEAKRIILDAEKEAEELIRKAKEEALRIKEETKLELKKEMEVHNGSIQLAIRQGVSALRQEIEKIFSAILSRDIEMVMSSEDAISRAVSVIFELIEKNGLGVNLGVLIPKHVDIQAICKRLVEKFKHKLQSSAIPVDGIKGGVEIKLIDKKISIEMTDVAVKELLASYVIPELRAQIFCEG
jgi:V/A-type H+-transporting ATPase subunit E